jgi:hypothetical protein
LSREANVRLAQALAPDSPGRISRMSHTPSLSQPPEPLTATNAHAVPPQQESSSGFDQTIRRLRAELAATGDRARQARLLAQVADLEERSADEAAAARDYLAAFNADPNFREPLEGLVRLLEKRRSLKNLGKLVGALVRAAASPDEKVRALLMRAAYQADVSGEVAEAKASALEATEVEGASTAEQASTWLALEVLAGRTGDPATRVEALGHRVAHAHQPTWRALLMLDRAHLLEASGEVEAALALVEEARALGSQAHRGRRGAHRASHGGRGAGRRGGRPHVGAQAGAHGRGLAAARRAAEVSRAGGSRGGDTGPRDRARGDVG